MNAKKLFIFGSLFILTNLATFYVTKILSEKDLSQYIFDESISTLASTKQLRHISLANRFDETNESVLLNRQHGMKKFIIINELDKEIPIYYDDDGKIFKIEEGFDGYSTYLDGNNREDSTQSSLMLPTLAIRPENIEKVTVHLKDRKPVTVKMKVNINFNED